MQAIYVPKYKIYYRVSPKEPNVLQWSNKPFGPATQWQTAMRFGKPIRALDTDDKTGQGVVVLNDSSTYVGSGVRVWGRKFYPAGTRIYSLYAIGESKMKHKLKIKIHESMSDEDLIYTLTKLAYKVEDIVDNNPEYVCYYDGGKTYPELYVEGYLLNIGGKNSDSSVDSQIEEWQKDIRAAIKKGEINKNNVLTSICLGIPYQKDTQDYTAGVDMPTEEEWKLTTQLFEPNYSDPTIGTMNVELNTMDEINKWIGTH